MRIIANEKVFEIMSQFLDSVKSAEIKHKIPNKKALKFSPFFSSINVKEIRSLTVEVVNGGVKLVTDTYLPNYHGLLEVRMGDYKKGGGAAYNTFELPIDLDSNSAKFMFFPVANETLWDCANDYHARIGKSLGFSETRDKYCFFSREEPVIYSDLEKKLAFDIDEIKHNLKRVSSSIRHPDLFSMEATFYANKQDMYVMNSEGSKVYSSYVRYGLKVEMNVLGSNNLLIPTDVVYRSTDLKKLPSYDQLIEKCEKAFSDLLEIKKAPIEKNGLYPCLFDHFNHGVLWHEMFGHGIEGHTISDGEELDDDFFEPKSSLFEGKIGKKIVPSFLSVYDDPTLEHLDAHYKYDEECVKAQKVTLIENGVLKNYLHSRESAGFHKLRSSGHARAEENYAPVPRMSNIVVKSSNEVSYEELKENLIKEIRRQKKDYGLIMNGSCGGWVDTTEDQFSTYPIDIFRVYKNGKEKRVRGIYVTGSVYQMLESILQTSSEYDIFNGSCGSESGFVPSTQTAPHALLRNVEINRLKKEHYKRAREPILKKNFF